MSEESLVNGAGIAVCVFSILLVTYAIFFRGKPFWEDMTARWLLLFGFVVLSPLAYLLSFAMVFEESKTVEFCNSCHVMETRVADLKDPDSEYLAARHYQYRWIADHQCYHCHTDYNLFGGIRGKIAGFRHVWAYYVAGYELPLEIYGTYDNQICLYCHGPVRDFQELEEHAVHMEDLELSKKSCLGSDCHLPTHPKERRKSGL